MNKYRVEIRAQFEDNSLLGVEEVHYAKDDIEAGRLAMIKTLESFKHCTGVRVERVRLIQEGGNHE